jgi:F-type H+-transporting ATPase subunit alpha
MPIIETIGGDLTGYVQTNLISMSDGHTLFDLETFYKGIRPAINIGLSVSRVGKQTQTKLQKYVASELRTMLAQYEDAKNFVRFGAELTDSTKALFLKGTIFEELVKQDLTTYLRREQQLIIMLALLDGFFDPYPINQTLEIRYFLLEAFADPKHEPLFKALSESADAEVRQPLQDAFYAELKQRLVAQQPSGSEQKAGNSDQEQVTSDQKTEEGQKVEGGSSEVEKEKKPEEASKV